MKSSLRLALTVIVLALSAVACAGMSSDSTTTAVATPASLDTPPAPTASAAEPTAAPIVTLSSSTDTPTPEPPPTITATPTVPATPDPDLGVGAEVYTDQFDGTSGWNWTYSDDVVDFGAKDGELKVATKQGNNTWRFVIRSDITIGDQLLRVTANTTACPGNDEYGVMFRAKFDDSQVIHSYIFKLNCTGGARLERLDDTDSTALKDWEIYPAIKPGAPAENAIMVWMAKDQFHFYVNDQYLFSLTDSSLAEGFYGFYAQSHSNGGGVLSFDDMNVKEVALP